jgi:hypothetical protein
MSVKVVGKSEDIKELLAILHKGVEGAKIELKFREKEFDAKLEALRKEKDIKEEELEEHRKEGLLIKKPIIPAVKADIKPAAIIRPDPKIEAQRALRASADASRKALQAEQETHDAEKRATALDKIVLLEDAKAKAAVEKLKPSPEKDEALRQIQASADAVKRGLAAEKIVHVGESLATKSDVQALFADAKALQAVRNS